MNAPAPRAAVKRFFRADAAGGIFLFAAALLALVMENFEAGAEWRGRFLHASLDLGAGGLAAALSLEDFVNNGLMAVFFLLVALEIKRELLEGALSTRSRAILPAVAAVGGMAAPAAIYSALNWGDAENMRGWAIPTATDIAFSLGVLSLLGRRVPVEIRVFLTAVAVADDLGAILIVALFYTAKLDAAMLALAGAALFALRTMNRRGVAQIAPYMIAGVILWFFILRSGVHATLAGVAAALFVPLRACGENPPLIRLRRGLHAPVAFFILPLFAFVNAGVKFDGLTWGALLRPAPLGVALGLVFGKTVGIYGATWLAAKTGLAKPPAGATWRAVFCVAVLCGVGFTMNLFIGNLSFAAAGAEKINAMHLGVLAGSTAAGVLGFLALRFIAYPDRASPPSLRMEAAQ